MLIAWAIGGPVFGALSDRLGLRRPLYIAGSGIIVLCWGLIVVWPDMPLTLLITLLILSGFASGCMIIGFAFAKESVPGRLAGTVSGVVNMGVMMGPMFLQPAVGWMLDRGWQTELLHGVRVFGVSAYQSGFLLLLAWAIASLLLVLFTRETGATQAVH